MLSLVLSVVLVLLYACNAPCRRRILPEIICCLQT